MAETAPPRPPGPLAVAAGVVAVFLVVLTFLALQVRTGEDPAIGVAKADPATEPRRVLVRRIVRRRVVVVTTRPASTAASVDSVGDTQTDSTVGGAAPAAAPAPAPAPAPAAAAPAPAPAPVVSRAS